MPLNVTSTPQFSFMLTTHESLHLHEVLNVERSWTCLQAVFDSLFSLELFRYGDGLKF
jgi:hypothetical protein